MGSNRQFGHSDHNSHGGHGEWQDGSDDVFEMFDDFAIPDLFKFDLDDFDLTSLGKVTDYDISETNISVTLGKTWTFDIDGSGFEFTLKGGAKTASVTAGIIDSFTIDGPGKADFSISGLDLSAKDFYKALVNLDGSALLDLVLGGDETISGSGFGDFIFAGKGNDTLYGNKGADRLQAGNGDDLLDGGVGNDYLEGGDGTDTFAFSGKSGRDVVVDFDAGADVIDLTSLGFAGSFDDFLADYVNGGSDDRHDRHGGDWDEGHGGDWDEGHGGGHGHGHGCSEDDGIVIDLGKGNAILLKDVSADALSEANFLF